MGPILFLYYEESLVSSNLNSKPFRFHSDHPNVYILFKQWRLIVEKSYFQGAPNADGQGQAAEAANRRPQPAEGPAQHSPYRRHKIILQRAPNEGQDANVPGGEQGQAAAANGPGGEQGRAANANGQAQAQPLPPNTQVNTYLHSDPVIHSCLKDILV